MKRADSGSAGGVRPRKKPDQPPILAFHDNLSYRLTVLYTTMVKTTAAVYAEEELTSNQWKVMSVLYHFAPMPASVILKWSTLDKATISRTIQSLSRQGLVSRQLNASDARTVDVQLTARGRDKYARMGSRIKTLQERLFQDLSGREVQALFATLDRIEQRLLEPQPGVEADRG